MCINEVKANFSLVLKRHLAESGIKGGRAGSVTKAPLQDPALIIYGIVILLLEHGGELRLLRGSRDGAVSLWARVLMSLNVILTRQ